MSPRLALADPAVEPAMAPPERLLSPRTVLSLVAAALIVAVAVWRAPIDWGDAWNRIRHANPWIYLSAVAVYWGSFGIRAWRWKLLLQNAGERRPVTPLVPIVIVSFFVNCVVPAKMGDVYRAYLARQRQQVGVPRALGTIIAERLLDLIVLMAMLLAAGGLVFRNSARGILIPYIVLGVGACLAGVGVLAVMRAGRGQRLLRLLPEAVFHRYENFRVGVVGSLRRLRLVAVLSVAVWISESARLGLVVYSLGDQRLLSLAQLILIALVAALLTTVPFLPGGIGLVEAGMVGVLVAVGRVDHNAALSIALLDRSISYGSVVLIGAIVFAVTHVRVARVASTAGSTAT